LQKLDHGGNFISAEGQIAYTDEMASWRDRISPKRFSAAQFLGNCLETMNGVVVLVFNEIITQLVPQGYMECAGSPEIFDSVLDGDMQSAAIPRDVSNGRVNIYPGTVFYSHFLQLLFHRSGLIAKNGDRLICLSRRAAHLAQLSVDRPELLLVEDMIAAPLNKGDDGVGRNEQQRKKAHPIAKFIEIAILFGASGVALYHGLPRSNACGFLITCVALLCFMSAFAIVFSLLP
jgi:hypothetical protein